MTPRTVCPFKNDFTYRYGKLSEDEQERFKLTPRYNDVKQCLECIGFDDTCPKYLNMIKMGFVKNDI